MTIGGNNTPAGGAAGREHNTPSYTTLTIQTNGASTIPANYSGAIAAADKLTFPSGGVTTTATLDDFRRNFNQLATDFQAEISNVQGQVTKNDTDLGTVKTKFDEHDADLIAIAKDLDQRAFRNLLINTGTGLLGGGDLEADRTLSLDIAGATLGGVKEGGDILIDDAGVMTIAPDSVALGTDTTGNYVATIADSGSTDIVVNNSGTEDAAITLGLTETVTAQSSFLGGVSGNTVTLPKIKFDARGRITGKGTTTFQSANDSTININAGAGLSGTNSFTLNQTSGASLSIAHGAGYGATDKDNSPSDVVAYNNNVGTTDVVHHSFPIIKKLGVDTYGHIDELTTTTLTYGLSNSPKGGYAAGGEYHINVPRESDFMQVEQRVGSLEGDIADRITLVGAVATISRDTNITGKLEVGGDFEVNTNKFVVTSSTGDVKIAGDVGIGTSATPLAPLHIDQTTAGADALVIQGADPQVLLYDDTDAASSLKIRYNGGGSGVTAGFRLQMYNQSTDTAGSNILQVTTSGDINAPGTITAAGDINVANAAITTNASVGGTVTATTFSGSGASLTNLPATSLTGTINKARLPSATDITSTGTLSSLTVSGNLEVNNSAVLGDAKTDSVTLSGGSFNFHDAKFKVVYSGTGNGTDANPYVSAADAGSDTPTNDNFRMALRNYWPGSGGTGAAKVIHTDADVTLGTSGSSSNDYLVFEKTDNNGTSIDGGFAWFGTAQNGSGAALNVDKMAMLNSSDFKVYKNTTIGTGSSAKTLHVTGNTTIAGNLQVAGTLDAEGISVDGALDDITSLGLSGALTSTNTEDADSATDSTAAISTDGGLAVTKKGFFGGNLSTTGAFTAGGGHFDVDASGHITDVGTITAGGNITTSGNVSAADLQATGLVTASTDLILGGNIIHSGDPNCKIGFPANDTFTVSTDGSERLRVDSSGNVGIGTASPSQNGSSTTLHIDSSTNGSAIRLSQGSSNSLIRYTDAIGLKVGTITSENLTLQTGDADRITIDTNGNVGIGETSPNGLLELATSGENRLIVRSTGTSDAVLQLTTGTWSSNKDWTIRLDNDDSDQMEWRYDNSHRMSLTTGGKLGIGVDDPTTKLEVAGDIKLKGGAPIIYFQETDQTIGQHNNSPTTSGFSDISGGHFRIVGDGGNFSIRRNTHSSSAFSTEAYPLNVQADGDMLIGENVGNQQAAAIFIGSSNTDVYEHNIHFRTPRMIFGPENIFEVQSASAGNNNRITFGVTNNTSDVTRGGTNNYPNDTVNPGDGNTDVGFTVRRITGDDRGVIGYFSRQDGSTLILNTNESGNVMDLNVAGNQAVRFSAGSGTSSPLNIGTRTEGDDTISDRIRVAKEGNVHLLSQTVIHDESSAIDGNPTAVLHLRSTSSDHLRFEDSSGTDLGKIDVDSTDGMTISSHGSTNKKISLTPNTTTRVTIEDLLTTMSNRLSITTSTDTSSSTTGALVVSGGVGIAKKLHVGTDLSVIGNTILGNQTSDTTTIKGSLSAADGNFDVDSSGHITDVGNITSDGHLQVASFVQNGSTSSNYGVFNGDLFVGDNTTTRQFSVDSATGNIFTYGTTTTQGKLTVGTDGIEFSDGSSLTSATVTRLGRQKTPVEIYSGYSAVTGLTDNHAFIDFDGNIIVQGENRLEMLGQADEGSEGARGFQNACWLPHSLKAAKVYGNLENLHAIDTNGHGWVNGSLDDSGGQGEFNNADVTKNVWENSSWLRWGTNNDLVTFSQFISSGDHAPDNAYALDTNGHLWGYGQFQDGQLADGRYYGKNGSGHAESSRPAYKVYQSDFTGDLPGYTRPRPYDFQLWNDSSMHSSAAEHTLLTSTTDHTASEDNTTANQGGLRLANFRDSLAYPSFGSHSSDPDRRRRVPHVMTPVADASGNMVHGVDQATQFYTTFTQVVMYGSSDYEGIIALGANGQVMQCGYGGKGQHGSSSTVDIRRNAHWRIVRTSSTVALSNIVEIFAHGDDNLTTLYAKDSSGNLWGWGCGEEGCLGLGDTNNRSYATKIWNATTRGVGCKKIHTSHSGSDNVALVWLETEDTIPKFYYTGDNYYWGPGLTNTPVQGTNNHNNIHEWTELTWGPFNRTNYKIKSVYHGDGRTESNQFVITETLVDNDGYGDNSNKSKVGEYQLHVCGHNTKNATGLWGQRSAAGSSDNYGTYVTRMEQVILPSNIVSKIKQIESQYAEGESRTLLYLNDGRIFHAGYIHFGIRGHNKSSYNGNTFQEVNPVSIPS